MVWGVSLELVTTHPRIVWVEFQPRQQRGSTPNEKKRLTSVEHMLRKARYLPLPWRLKKVVLQLRL